MKTIVLYANRNVGLIAMTLLLAKGYKVKVMTEDGDVWWLATELGLEIVSLDTMGDCDLFLSVHGRRIIPMKYLEDCIAINVHPCLKYKGVNPVKRYIENKDTQATIDAHIMIEKADEGAVIYSEHFETPIINSYAEFYNLALPFYFRAINYTIEKVL